MGRPPGTDPDLEDLEELEEEGLPDEHVVRRYLMTHERPQRNLPRRNREPAARKRRSDRKIED